MKLFKKCSELPYYNFVKILTTDDYTWLNVERSGDDQLGDEHTHVWNELYQEYMTLTKNTRQVAILRLLKEITIINLRLDHINQIINFMANDFDMDLVKILRSYGFQYKYDPYSDAYDQDLKMTLSAAKSMIIRKESAESELAALKADSEGSGQATEQDYLALLIGLSKFMGYRIDWKVVSVAEYVELLNSFTKYSEKNGK